MAKRTPESTRVERRTKKGLAREPRAKPEAMSRRRSGHRVPQVCGAIRGGEEMQTGLPQAMLSRTR